MCNYRSTFGSCALKCVSSNVVLFKESTKPVNRGGYWYWPFHCTHSSKITPQHRFLRVFDPSTSLIFLIDNWAEISLLPKDSPTSSSSVPAPDIAMHAANGTPISWYGQQCCTLDFNLRRTFKWIIVMSLSLSWVQQSILGADFLNHFNLVVDLRRRSLVGSSPLISLFSIIWVLLYSLTGLSCLFKSYSSHAPVKHNVEHHIEGRAPSFFQTFFMEMRK